MNVPLLVPEQHWTCPNCTVTAVTRIPPGTPASQMHTCMGLKGLTAPMVEEGVAAKVEALERDDYVGREHVTTDGDGRPVMAVEVTRDDGTDRAVYAPLAVAGREDI